jgi:hypothetical protein
VPNVLFVKDNVVRADNGVNFNFYNQAWIRGYHVEKSDGFKLKCNEAHRLGVGYEFDLSNKLNAPFLGGFVGNQLDDNFTQFIANNNGQIGDQGNKFSSTVSGSFDWCNFNKWTNNVSGIGSGVTVNNTLMTLGSTGINNQFYVDPITPSGFSFAVYDPSPLSMNNPQSFGIQMIPQQVTPPKNNIDACPTIIPHIKSPFPHHDDFAYMDNQTEGKWNGRRSLFEFYAANVKDRSYHYLYDALTIDEANELDTIHAIQNEFVDEALTNGMLLNWYQSEQKTSIGKFYTIDSLIVEGHYAEAFNLNSQIPLVIQPEINQQLFNQIVLNHLLASSPLDSLSSENYAENDIQQLINIAVQCPINGGSAVYQARGILDVQGVVYIVDENVCGFNGSNLRKLSEANKLPNTNKLLLYPNPTNDFTIIELTEDVDDIASVQLYDVTGKKLDCFKTIKLSATKVKMNTSCLASGFYTCKLVAKNGKVYYGKLIKE